MTWGPVVHTKLKNLNGGCLIPSWTSCFTSVAVSNSTHYLVEQWESILILSNCRADNIVKCSIGRWVRFNSCQCCNRDKMIRASSFKYSTPILNPSSHEMPRICHPPPSIPWHLSITIWRLVSLFVEQSYGYTHMLSQRITGCPWLTRTCDIL
jgi:hypothetical protein